jgi:hypothetical protein
MDMLGQGIHVYIYVYTYIYINICIHIYIYIYTYICINIHTYIHISMYIFIHKNIYTMRRRHGHAGARSVRMYSTCKSHLTEYYSCVHLTFSTSHLSTDYITITSTIIHIVFSYNNINKSSYIYHYFNKVSYRLF